MKQIRILFLLLLSLLLGYSAKETDKTLENLRRLSSVSFSDSGGSIDNYYNVEHYSYQADYNKNSPIQVLRDCHYFFLDDLDIPGMPDTKADDFMQNRIYSTSQCPQGMCFTEDYIIFSSYSTEAESLGELLVFDRQDYRYLFTIGMKAESHLGGIAYDGENIWACNSDHMCVERLSYDFICLMAEENCGKLIDASEIVDVYPVENAPSCITFYDGRLWIATHTQIGNSQMLAYYFDARSNTLQALSAFTIPSKVQGIAFREDGMVYLSTSYGRRSSSYLKIYSGLSSMDAFPGNPSQTIEMPPCSEEILLENSNLYLLFESAGEKYYEGTDGLGVSLSPLDRVICIFIDENGFIIHD